MARPTKRQRHNDLNSRFERMLQRIDSSVVSTSKAANRRKRLASAGSSSSLGYDAPKTPIDSCYSAATGNSLGAAFTVIKSATDPPHHNRSSSEELELEDDGDAASRIGHGRYVQVRRSSWSLSHHRSGRCRHI